MKIVNPASGAVIADVAADSSAAVRRKYQAARAGQVAWAKLPLAKRIAAIAAFRERIVAMHETLARTLTQEVGKPIRQSRNELNGLLQLRPRRHPQQRPHPFQSLHSPPIAQQPVVPDFDKALRQHVQSEPPHKLPQL